MSDTPLALDNEKCRKLMTRLEFVVIISSYRRCRMENRMTPKTQKTRNRQRAKLQKRRKQILRRRIIIFGMLIIAIIVGAVLMKTFTPSKETVKLDEYYGIKAKEQLAVVINDEIIEELLTESPIDDYTFFCYLADVE